MPLTSRTLRFLMKLVLRVHGNNTIGRSTVQAIVITGLGIVCLAWPTASRAQATADWVGKRVVQRYSQLELKIESQVVEVNDWLETYQVEQTNGPWLWLHAGRFKGWVTADQVVPVEQAIEFFTDYIHRFPDDPHGYTMRGKMWQQEKKQFDAALADYDAALGLDPVSAYVYINRGTAWSDKEEFDRAIVDFSVAIRIDPNEASAYYGRATAWTEKQQDDKAIADYNEAIRIDPEDAWTYCNRGNAWRNKKEYDKAIADYSEAIRIDPKDALACYNRGLTWFDKLELSKAIADYNDAIRIDPKYSDAYGARGAAWEQRAAFEKAIADYNQAIRLNPNAVESLINRAWIMATCPDAKYRDGAKAVESALKACELTEWRAASLVDTLSAAYAEASKFDEAVKSQERAIGLLTEEAEKADYRTRLRLFQAKKPYHEEAR